MRTVAKAVILGSGMLLNVPLEKLARGVIARTDTLHGVKLPCRGEEWV
jgi:hypothetical protein